MAEISPSILAADFARLGEQVDDAARGGARMLHVDAMDGHFVPNISIGIPVVRSLSRWTDMVLDCHLMISNPDSYLDAFVCAGARMVTVHQEACPHLGRTVGRIKELGAAAGVALNPSTPIGTLEEVLPEVDLVLVMSRASRLRGARVPSLQHRQDRPPQRLPPPAPAGFPDPGGRRREPGQRGAAWRGRLRHPRRRLRACSARGM